MNPAEIKEKFGDYYTADEHTYIMGIDLRFTDHLAQRFRDMVVLETCTGGGFSTISIAKYAKHVFTVEIDHNRMETAKKNAGIAGVDGKITFINMDVMSGELDKILHRIDGAFLDPDWAVKGHDHVYRFVNSTTMPPSDHLLQRVFKITPDVTLIQPPFIVPEEFDHLQPFEREFLFMGNSHELTCLHFGSLATCNSICEFRV